MVSLDCHITVNFFVTTRGIIAQTASHGMEFHITTRNISHRPQITCEIKLIIIAAQHTHRTVLCGSISVRMDSWSKKFEPDMTS